jgi:hypothetical protein
MMTPIKTRALFAIGALGFVFGMIGDAFHFSHALTIAGTGCWHRLHFACYAPATLQRAGVSATRLDHRSS